MPWPFRSRRLLYLMRLLLYYKITNKNSVPADNLTMNSSTSLYKKMSALIDDAHKMREPVRHISNIDNDYDEMLRRMLKVMDDCTSLFSQIKEVSQLDDDKASTFILCQFPSDFGAMKKVSVAQLYAMRKMCIDVKKSIKPEFAKRYDDFSLDFIVDLTDFLNLYCYTHWDKGLRDNFVPFPIRVTSRPSLIINDQREVIRSMFWLESIPTIDKLSVRDIRPHIQIMIRQSLEMMFRQIIGYVDIVDSAGNRIKKFTQIGAKFLSNYRNKKELSGCQVSGDGWTIDLKMPIKSLERLNTWCNSFTHDPYIEALPIIYFAYDQYERFTDGCVTKPDYEISGEGFMRAEFECFVLKQDPKAYVKWPDGVSNPEPTAGMRRKAIKQNISNIKRALWNEYKELLAISTCPFIRRTAKMLSSQFRKG